MGFWSKLIGGGVKEAAEGVSQTLDSTGGLLKNIRTAITGVDADSKARIEEALTKIEGNIQSGTQRLNEMNAASGSIFLAGWRPFIGWVSGFGLAAYFLPQYTMGSIVWLRAAWLCMPYMKDGALIVPQIPAYPVSPDGLLNLVGALLGIGLMRTYEKHKGVNNKH